MSATTVEPAPPADAVRWVLGTPLRVTDYDALIAECQRLARGPGPVAVDFTNAHIVTMRRRDAAFRDTTACMDGFIPDGMPLVWCLRAAGAKLRDRVYGPEFMRRCVRATPAPWTHYLLGGSEDCLAKLKSALTTANGGVQLVGAHHGYFSPDDEGKIFGEINRLSPDFIWVGLGTPKQQEWIQRNKPRLRRGVVFAVGFAFDVNAGTKPDAPRWMQRAGLTWLFRAASEPRRLAGRYLLHNSLFLLYLLWDGLRGRLFEPKPRDAVESDACA
jgi:N-acetylglucosaminyldiphosphoundecaprenol N-acetyl-beta-D-mannosaminyltransferase